ncbi:uncharacterized protein LOC132204989 [Neocloeon triangulifer]|uniref:uncharacterized protein LOC132204989 n=1 Tax=Neocloeon triangulifer TaxID=2078957 RepID=UPI00286EE771|nr:uncharacterized protein LOC132204989 [Neocloeon triangulifer]
MQRTIILTFLLFLIILCVFAIWELQWVFLLNFYVNLLRGLMDLRVHLFVFSIHRILVKVNGEIQYIVINDGEKPKAKVDLETNLLSLVEIHRGACELILAVSKHFQGTLISTLFSNFINTTTTCYYVLLLLGGLEDDPRRFLHALVTLIWLIISCLNNILLCFECDETIVEARKASKLLWKLEYKEQQIDYQVRELRTKVMINEKCEFSIYGMFAFNKTFLAQNFTAIVGYIFTALQFHIISMQLSGN